MPNSHSLLDISQTPGAVRSLTPNNMAKGQKTVQVTFCDVKNVFRVSRVMKHVTSKLHSYFMCKFNSNIAPFT